MFFSANLIFDRKLDKVALFIWHYVSCGSTAVLRFSFVFHAHCKDVLVRRGK